MLQQKHSNTHTQPPLSYLASFHRNGLVHHDQTVLVLDACDVLLVSQDPHWRSPTMVSPTTALFPARGSVLLAFKERRAYCTPIQHVSQVYQDEQDG